MKPIPFPEDEIDDIKKRINKKENIFTIRCSKEFNKYNEGDLLKTGWGDALKVVDVKKAKSFVELREKFEHFNTAMKKHPDKMSEIKKFKDFDIIELRSVR
ncbi:MAG: hypothetical protein ABIA78_00780 [archaeon]